MPYTTEQMLDDFRKDVARLTAENARLRAACEAALDDVSLVNRTDGLHLASYDILRAALAHKEPSDA